jgi:threonine synthase
MVKKTGGWFVVVEETRILRGRDQLAQRGFYVEPTSALVWQALEDTLPVLPDPVVVVLTGSGFKHTEYQSSRNEVF